MKARGLGSLAEDVKSSKISSADFGAAAAGLVLVLAGEMFRC